MIVGDPRQRARDLVEFAAGAEEFGYVQYARRARAVAGDVFELCDQLDSTRSLLEAQDERIDRLEALLQRRGVDGP